jgi:hypothetical protein
VGVQNFNCSLASTAFNVPLTQASGLPIFSQSGYSVAGWFKYVRRTSASQYIYAEASTSSNNPIFGIRVTASTNLLGVLIRNDANVIQLNKSGNAVITPNVWNHFVWTDNNGTVQLYINGVADGANFSYTPATPYTLNTSALGVIKQASATGNLSGVLSGMQLFNYVLSPAQVALSLNGQLKGNVASNPLTEGAGTTAYDTSGNGNNGTITAGTYTSDVPSKTRGLVGGNLVYNGNFEFAPPTNVAQTTDAKYLDGTSGGSSTNALFGCFMDDYTGSGNQALLDAANPHTGQYSLKVSTTAIGSSVAIAVGLVQRLPASRYIPILPSTSYTLTYWMKTVANSGTATDGAFIDTVEYNGAGSYVTDTLGGVTGTTGWTQYKKVWTTNAATRFLKLGCFVKGDRGTGTLIMDAWFDDIVLTPTVNTTRGLV